MQEPDKIVKPNPSKSKPLPSLEFLKECFEYVEDTGVLFWKKRPLHHFKNAHGMNIFNSNWVGKEAGGIVECEGIKRRVVRILRGKHFMTHRIIFVMGGGPDPGELQIDHLDRNPLNNQKLNLRLATNQLNSANTARRIYKGKKRDLPKGVYVNGRNKWQAKIKVNYKVHCLGTYKSPKEASEAYMKAALQHFGEFSRQD